MHTEQSALGKRQVYTQPRFDYLRVAKITSIKDFAKTGKVEVKFTNGRGVPPPATVYFQGVAIDVKEGDLCLVGFVDGNKNNPCIIAFLNSKYKLFNYITTKETGVYLLGDVGYKDNQAADRVLQDVIDLIHQRLTALEQRMTEAEGRLDNMEGRLEYVENLAHSPD